MLRPEHLLPINISRPLRLMHLSNRLPGQRGNMHLHCTSLDDGSLPVRGRRPCTPRGLLVDTRVCHLFGSRYKRRRRWGRPIKSDNFYSSRDSEGCATPECRRVRASRVALERHYERHAFPTRSRRAGSSASSTTGSVHKHLCGASPARVLRRVLRNASPVGTRDSRSISAN